MASKRTDADSSLPIKVWDEIQAITEWLDRCEPSYRFVPGKGDILVKEHPPEHLTELRAIFEVYGKQIKKELPEDLRGVDWVALCDPTVGIYVQTRDDLFVSKVRRYQFEHLHEIAARAVAKYNAATLAGADSTTTALVEPAKKKPRGAWLADALLLLKKSEGRSSDSEIATAVEKNPGTISRSEVFQQARAAYANDAPSRGHKNAETGDVDAYTHRPVRKN